MTNETMSQTHLYRPRVAYRDHRAGRGTPPLATPAPYGVFVNYNLPEDAEDVRVRFSDSDGNLVREFSDLDSKEGLNRLIWEDMRYPGADEMANHPTRSSRNIGPYALPGTYQVELVVDGKSYEQAVELRKDPRSIATDAELERQFEFVSEVRGHD